MKHERTLMQRSEPAFTAASVAALLAAVVLSATVHAQTDALVLEANGNVGIGVDTPVRQLHLRGDNAVFRMDRDRGGASFFLARTDSNWNVLKSFQVGVIADGPNIGQFIINDAGQEAAGWGVNRMMITNSGDVQFTGTVRAPSFENTSSERYKQDIEPLRDVGPALQQLSGVRFTWKNTGQASLGLIAEEVAKVFPELVTRDDDTEHAEAVNYSALVAVLVEGFKTQQTELASYRAEVAAQQAQIDRLESHLAEFETLAVRLNRIEHHLTKSALQLVATPIP